LAEPVCSAVSLARVEPLQATASMVRNWVLIEQPGAWGPQALTESDLPAGVAARLAAAARAHRFRVLLLRRPERPVDGSRQCFVAHSGRTERWIEERRISDLEELLQVDFGPLAGGRPVGFGPRRGRPLYLVCTNGRHDPCCATLGRPVARALQDGGAAGSVWECSHFGGDRFAGNLVCLPDGLYFGRLDPATAERVVRSYEQGTIDLEHYRGRAGQPFAAQAAEFFVRRQEGLTGLEDLTWISHRHRGDRVVEVSFARAGGGTYDVRVGVEPATEARPLSCHAHTEERPPTYSLLEMNRG
jgi:hypothetical protein